MAEVVVIVLIIISVIVNSNTKNSPTQKKFEQQTKQIQQEKPVQYTKQQPRSGNAHATKSTSSMKPVVKHNEADHTHDRLSSNIIVHETRDEHYRHQIAAFQKSGLIGKKEAEVLWENYLKSKEQYNWED